MGNKNNIPKGVQAEFEDVDYWHKLSRRKTIELPDGSVVSEYEYMKKFMHESYANNFSRSEPEKNLLQTDEQKAWARRNNNNTNRDALLVSKKMGALNALLEVERHDYKEKVEDWENTFKTGTYEDSLKELFASTCDNMGVTYNKPAVREFIRFYFRIKRFLKLVRADMKTKEET